jgi:hypothetical protein
MAEAQHVPPPGDLPEEFLDEEPQFDLPLDLDFDDNDIANMPEDWEIDDETTVFGCPRESRTGSAQLCQTTTPTTNSISAAWPASSSAPQQRRHALVTEF